MVARGGGGQDLQGGHGGAGVEVALTEASLDGVGGELAKGAVIIQGAETLDAIVGASILAVNWEGARRGCGGVSRAPWGPPGPGGPTRSQVGWR